MFFFVIFRMNRYFAHFPYARAGLALSLGYRHVSAAQPASG